MKRDGKLRTKTVGRVQILACLNMEISVFSRFKVSFGDFRQFFAAGPEFERVGKCEAVLRKRILKVPQS